jgi:hypothetical protein
MRVRRWIRKRKRRIRWKRIRNWTRRIRSRIRIKRNRRLEWDYAD